MRDMFPLYFVSPHRYRMEPANGIKKCCCHPKNLRWFGSTWTSLPWIVMNELSLRFKTVYWWKTSENNKFMLNSVDRRKERNFWWISFVSKTQKKTPHIGFLGEQKTENLGQEKLSAYLDNNTTVCQLCPNEEIVFCLYQHFSRNHIDSPNSSTTSDRKLTPSRKAKTRAELLRNF